MHSRFFLSRYVLAASRIQTVCATQVWEMTSQRNGTNLLQNAKKKKKECRHTCKENDEKLKRYEKERASNTNNSWHNWLDLC